MAWQWFEAPLRVTAVVRLLDSIYALWFAALLFFVVWASWSCHQILRRRAITALLLLWVVGGTLAAGALASGGPCYYEALVGPPNPYAPLMARLDEVDRESPLLARFNQRELWAMMQAGRWAAFGGISAMPSLHVGIAVLFALTAWQVSRAIGAALAVYAVAVHVGSIALGWHYAVDGYAGAAIAWLCWWLAGAVAGGRQSESPAVSGREPGGRVG